jgi:hypothetical protein
MSTSSSSQPSVAALRPQWRAVRVAVLGATSLLLATSAHAVGGGDLPAPGVLAVTAIVLGLLAVPLTCASMQNWRTAGCPRSATNLLAPVLQARLRRIPAASQRPGGLPVTSWAPRVSCTARWR